MTEFTDPAVLVLRRGPRPDTSWASPASWLGGRPGLGDAPWPKSTATGLPLHFAAQIDVAALRSVAPGVEIGHDGALAFFITPVDQKLEGAVVAVPPSGQAAFVAPPENTPPIGEPGAGRLNIVPGARGYPYWPVDLVTEGPDAPALAGSSYTVEVVDAQDMHALPDTVFWDTPQRLAAVLDAVAETLPENTGGEAVAITDKRTKLEAARAEAERLGPPAGFLRRLLGKGTTREAVDAAAEKVTRLETALSAAVEERARMVEAFATFRADLAAWAGAHDATEIMGEQDRVQLAEIGKRQFREFRDVTQGRTSFVRSYATVTIREFVVGDDCTAALVPPGECGRLAVEHRAPVGAHHRMLGGATPIQDEFLGHEDKRLLLQLRYDDLMCFYFGDVGQISFLIAPDDLAAGRFDSLTMVTASH